MLDNAVAAADAVQHSSKLDPWGAIKVEVSSVIADLKLCREKVVSPGKAVKDTRERRFGAETAAPSADGEVAPRTTVRISDVVEVGDVQYVEEHNKLGLFCCSRSVSCAANSKKRRVPVRPVAAKKNIFLLKVRLLAVLHSKLLSEKVSGSRVQEEVVVIAVMPQFPKGDKNNSSFLYMYRLLAFEILC